MNIKALPAADRPRERLARHGHTSLSTVELLAIILGSGTQKRPVLELASALLRYFGTLHALKEATIEELRQVEGIGNAKAVQLQAAFALFERLEPVEEKTLFDHPGKVYDAIRTELENEKVELLMVVLRDVKRRCIHREIVAKGTVNELLIHPREIFHIAIRHRAHNVIIAHNHPTGDPNPSTQDLEMTHLLVGAGKIVGIELADHLIIGKGRYLSLFQSGYIKSLSKNLY